MIFFHLLMAVCVFAAIFQIVYQMIADHQNYREEMIVRRRRIEESHREWEILLRSIEYNRYRTTKKVEVDVDWKQDGL